METILELTQSASLIQTITYFTFMVAFMGMAAGAFFFFMERNAVEGRYRETMAVTALILSIAAINYFYMQGLYRAAVVDGSDSFPTVFRYIDWILTTPLMLMKFPLLLGLGKKGQAFLAKLVLLDVGMIGFAFAGELLEANVGQRQLKVPVWRQL